MDPNGARPSAAREREAHEMIQEMEGGVRPTIVWASIAIGVAAGAWVLWQLWRIWKDRRKP